MAKIELFIFKKQKKKAQDVAASVLSYHPQLIPAYFQRITIYLMDFEWTRVSEDLSVLKNLIPTYPDVLLMDLAYHALTKKEEGLEDKINEFVKVIVEFIHFKDDKRNRIYRIFETVYSIAESCVFHWVKQVCFPFD